MNKTGSFFDILYIGVFVFVVAIMVTVGWMIQSRINTEWQAKTELGTTSQEIMQSTTTRYVALWDGVFLTIFVGLYLGSLILAYNVDINPIFFFLSLLIMGVIVVVMAILGNSWYAFANNSEMSGYIDDFVIIPYVMANYVKILVVMAFGLAGVMYAKTQ
jgi:hypothetical protein